MSKVVIWVSDLETQTRFYSALFGVVTPVPDNGFVEIADSENSVLLHMLPPQFAATTPLTEQLPVQDEVAIKPVFTVESLEAAQVRTRETLATFDSRVSTYGAFQYQDVIDPEGNVIQLQQRTAQM